MANGKKENEIPNQQGSQYTDPTYNVLQLVEAAVKRLDDLSGVRADCVNEVIELNKEILNLHISYGKELREAESKRIDAIRAVDVGAVTRASEVSASQAMVLADQLSKSNEANRALVATTATTIATQLTQIISPLTDRVGLLEKGQYEKTGLAGVPQTVLDKLDAVAIAVSQTKQGSMTTDKIISYLIALAAVLWGIFHK